MAAPYRSMDACPWKLEFFENFNPSIDCLELYALLAGVVTWVPHLTNCTELFHFDNTPTVHALINKSSDSCQMMILLQFLTLFCMLNNITITAKHISGKANLMCNYLNQFKLQDFHWIKPVDTQPLSTAPSSLVWPISGLMQNIWSL